MAWDSLFSLFSITLSLCPYVFRLFRVYLYLWLLHILRIEEKIIVCATFLPNEVKFLEGQL